MTISSFLNRLLRIGSSVGLLSRLKRSDDHRAGHRWARRLERIPGVRIHTPFDPDQSCGLANVGLDAVDCSKLADHLWTKYRIIVVPIKRDDYQGIRVTPNVYTTLDEIDTFAGIVEDVARRGAI